MMYPILFEQPPAPTPFFPDFMEDVVKGEVGDYLKGVVTMG